MHNIDTRTYRRPGVRDCRHTFQFHPLGTKKTPVNHAGIRNGIRCCAFSLLVCAQRFGHFGAARAKLSLLYTPWFLVGGLKWGGFNLLRTSLSLSLVCANAIACEKHISFGIELASHMGGCAGCQVHTKTRRPSRLDALARTASHGAIAIKYWQDALANVCLSL